MRQESGPVCRVAGIIAGVRITYLGHATVLIELDGLELLTDPLLRRRVLHLRRVVPGVTREQLANVDAVLISHAHHDHLDTRSLRMVGGTPRALCPEPARRAVAGAGLTPEVMGVGGYARVGGVEIEAVRAEHDGRRFPQDRRSDAIGFFLRGAGGSVYFAGDTGWFEEIGEVGEVDVALLPVAGWGPRLGPGHLDPEEAARAAARIEPRVAIPIHWGTYERLAMTMTGHRSDPARRFCDQLAELAPGVSAELLEPGESLEIDPAPSA
jgi:L-ascorbate metabolism protein UlaG (beta-lactamase superfamily)